MSTSKYTWNSSTGKLSIDYKNINGGIVVTADSVPNKYNITYSGLDGATLSTKPTTHTYGTATTVGNPSKTGYTFAGWKVNGGSAQNGATAYTANITLEATWTANKYNTSNGSDTSSDNESSSAGESDTNSSSGVFTSDEITHTPDDGSQSEDNDNPTTGIAVSLVPLAAALTFVTITVKRKKK